MAKGENIFKRKDGRWEARYIKGHEPSGKIRYGFCYGKTYREAKEKVTKCRAALFSGQPADAGAVRRRFAFYCDEWLRCRRPQIRDSTYIKYSTVLEKHIKPLLGGCFPSGVTTQSVDAFTQVLLQQEKLAPKSVHDILVVLQSICKYAAAHFPGLFPPLEIHYPRESRKEPRVLSAAEQQQLVHYLQLDMDCCKFGVLLALFTGMRIGELCALQWGRINLSEQTIRVSATMQRLQDTAEEHQSKTHVVIGTPKSDTSVRTIPMTPYVAELCRRMETGDPAAYILTGTTAYMEPRALQYRIGKYTHACGLEGVHCHTLRHTFATRAVEVGFEIKSLSEILGHATTTITLERYVHSSMELKRQNMSKLAVAGF